MKISNSHQKFADQLKDQTALESPGEFLGPNWKDVLNFWLYLDTLSYEEFVLIGERYYALDEDSRTSAKTSALVSAKDTIGNEYTREAWWASFNLDPATWTICELIGSHNLESLKIFPLFLNL